MIIKITRMLALSGVLLWSGVAIAQSASPTSGSSSPGGSPGAPGGSETGTTTTTTTTTEAILPADGIGIETEGVTVTTEENLPATGGAPLLMALVGAMTAGGAMLGLKKMR